MRPIIRFRDIPDNDKFKKQLIRDGLLILAISVVSGAGIALSLFLSTKDGW
jgi:hypothetical protein